MKKTSNVPLHKPSVMRGVELPSNAALTRNMLVFKASSASVKNSKKDAWVVNEKGLEMTLLKVLPFLMLTSLLGACNNKPPSCADEKTVEEAKKIIMGHASKELNKEKFANYSDDPDGLVRKFMDGLEIQLIGVVSEGYQEDAKKQMCKGTIAMTFLTGEKSEQEVLYSTQKTEDKDGKFLMEIEGAKPLIGRAYSGAVNYYYDNRWTGTWNGTYACGGIEGATESHQGAFSQPVSLVVDVMKAKLERTTKGGGIETLEGRMDNYQGLRLKGIGENTPEDKWETIFEGEVTGKNAVANGVIRLLDGTVLRECHLELTQQASPEAEGGKR